MKIDEEDVWLWYHHLENVKALGLAKTEYCTRYGLSKVKYGNFKYILNYCKESSPDRYKVMMDAAMEYEKVKGTITMREFCKPRRIKKDDLYVAMKHQEVKFIVLKRIADKVPPPELIDLEAQVVPEVLEPIPEAIAEEMTPEVEIAKIETPEPLPEEPTSEVEAKSVIEKWRELNDKPSLSLSTFISQRKLHEEPPPKVHFDEADDLERLSKEYEESLDENPEPKETPKRARKTKALDEEDKEPMKFFTLQTPAPLSPSLADSEWSDTPPALTRPLEPELPLERVREADIPELQLKGNRIELTFTKTVRLTAAPDTPHDKLLDIINLLKDL